MSGHGGREIPAAVNTSAISSPTPHHVVAGVRSVVKPTKTMSVPGGGGVGLAAVGVEDQESEAPHRRGRASKGSDSPVTVRAWSGCWRCRTGRRPYSRWGPRHQCSGRNRCPSLPWSPAASPIQSARWTTARQQPPGGQQQRLPTAASSPKGPQLPFQRRQRRRHPQAPAANALSLGGDHHNRPKGPAASPVAPAADSQTGQNRCLNASPLGQPHAAAGGIYVWFTGVWGKRGEGSPSLASLISAQRPPSGPSAPLSTQKEGELPVASSLPPLR